MNAIESFLVTNKEQKIKSIPVLPRKTITNKYNINNYFDHIYLINLKKRPDRLVKILQKLHRLQIKVQVIDAVNGRMEPYFTDYMNYLELPLDPKWSHKIEIERNEKVISSPGAWGYLLTWEKILKDAISKKYKNFLIFDDDIIFIKDFHKNFEFWIKDIRTDWKILQLGATQLTKFRNKITGKNKNYFHPMITDGSYATAVSSDVFSSLLQEVQRMNCPLDSGPLRAIYKLYPKRCYASWPHLIIADVGDSDIRGKRDLIKFAEKMDWNLELYETETDLDMISVVIVVRNLENDITTVLDSFIRQEYSKIELVIIEDGSTDKTYHVLEKYVDRHRKRKLHNDTPITLIKNKRLLGDKTCRELGFSNGVGKHKIFEVAKKGITCLNDQIERHLIQSLTKP